MNHKLFFSVLLSALFISGIVGYAYASDDTAISEQKGERGPRHEMQLTDEERAQRVEELQNLTFEGWKQKEIERINNFSEEEFNNMKERQLNHAEKLKECGEDCPAPPMHMNKPLFEEE